MGFIVPQLPLDMELDRENLTYYYIDKKLSLTKVAKVFDVNRTTIENKLKKFSIPKRTLKETKKYSHSPTEFKKDHVVPEEWITKNREWHLGRNQSEKTILKRSKSVREWYKNPENKKKFFEAHKRGAKKRVKWKITRNELYDLYYNEKLTIRQMAEKLNTQYSVVQYLLVKNNITRRNSLYGYNQLLACNDGHLVMSSKERDIDNWLFHNGIPHQIYKRIGNTLHKCDFFIPEANVWIEYWGLTGKLFYEQRMAKKQKLYQKLGLNLIDIYPYEDFKNKLKFLLLY